jgi:hypothetical protein
LGRSSFSWKVRLGEGIAGIVVGMAVVEMAIVGIAVEDESAIVSKKKGSRKTVQGVCLKVL